MSLEGAKLFKRAELIQADHDRLPGLRKRVELQDPVAFDGEVMVVGALPGPHRLKADALPDEQLSQPLVGDVRDYPLGDQIVRQLAQRPRRERLPRSVGSQSAIRLIS
jgi:hypothetical protein